MMRGMRVRQMENKVQACQKQIQKVMYMNRNDCFIKRAYSIVYIYSIAVKLTNGL